MVSILYYFQGHPSPCHDHLYTEQPHSSYLWLVFCIIGRVASAALLICIMRGHTMAVCVEYSVCIICRVISPLMFIYVLRGLTVAVCGECCVLSPGSSGLHCSSVRSHAVCGEYCVLSPGSSALHCSSSAVRSHRGCLWWVLCIISRVICPALFIWVLWGPTGAVCGEHCVLSPGSSALHCSSGCCEVPQGWLWWVFCICSCTANLYSICCEVTKWLCVVIVLYYLQGHLACITHLYSLSHCFWWVFCIFCRVISPAYLYAVSIHSGCSLYYLPCHPSSSSCKHACVYLYIVVTVDELCKALRAAER